MELAQDDAGDALFGILVEGLADRFEPSLCDAYGRLFSQAVAGVADGLDAASLLARYERVRQVRALDIEPHRIFVLSRVTLGADVAVTSVLLDAAKVRFPKTEIVFVGPRKNYELFAGDPRIVCAEVAYGRGGLRERLAVWSELRRLFAGQDAIVIDPDSRLTQLGMLPVCTEERYRFFESRRYGSETDFALPQLAAAWAAETLDVAAAKPYVALAATSAHGGGIAVSLGVGENPAKRLADPFEEELLRMLAATGAPISIDKGAGGEEARRVELAVERSGARVTYWQGSFAGFASVIAGSRLYVGYDSAGQHVAAAAGVPLISIFAGFPAQRMFERWRPVSEHARVIPVERPDAAATLDQVRGALSYHKF
jgi:ADP-heptose:LPS heptosyltransferase